MGIRPTGGTPIQLPSSNAQNQAAELVGSLETAGEVLGKQLSRIDATSRSANTVSAEMAVQIKSLQDRVAALEKSPPAHSHTQTDVNGLAIVLADIQSRLSALEHPPA